MFVQCADQETFLFIESTPIPACFTVEKKFLQMKKDSSLKYKYSHLNADDTILNINYLHLDGERLFFKV